MTYTWQIQKALIVKCVCAWEEGWGRLVVFILMTVHKVCAHFCVIVLLPLCVAVVLLFYSIQFNSIQSFYWLLSIEEEMFFSPYK